MEVTEIQCEIVPYTECSMTMESTTYKSHEMVPKTIKKKVCSEGMDIVQHTKMMPECRNVTKQNCISKFETDENGDQASDLAFLLLFCSTQKIASLFWALNSAHGNSSPRFKVWM